MSAHARVHPRPIPGCPWCPPTVCPCGGRCSDPAGCYRRWAASETTWRALAHSGGAGSESEWGRVVRLYGAIGTLAIQGLLLVGILQLTTGWLW